MARLSVGDATVGQLAVPYDVSVQAVSKHLKELEDTGLVSHNIDGPPGLREPSNPVNKAG